MRLKENIMIACWRAVAARTGCCDLQLEIFGVNVLTKKPGFPATPHKVLRKFTKSVFCCDESPMLNRVL